MSHYQGPDPTLEHDYSAVSCSCWCETSYACFFHPPLLLAVLFSPWLKRKYLAVRGPQTQSKWFELFSLAPNGPLYSRLVSLIVFLHTAEWRPVQISKYKTDGSADWSLSLSWQSSHQITFASPCKSYIWEVRKCCKRLKSTTKPKKNHIFTVPLFLKLDFFLLFSICKWLLSIWCKTWCL